MNKDHFLHKDHSLRSRRLNQNLVKAKLKFIKNLKEVSLCKREITKELLLSIHSNLIWNLFTRKKPKMTKRRKRSSNSESKGEMFRKKQCKMTSEKEQDLGEIQTWLQRTQVMIQARALLGLNFKKWFQERLEDLTDKIKLQNPRLLA